MEVYVVAYEAILSDFYEMWLRPETVYFANKPSLISNYAVMLSKIVSLRLIVAIGIHVTNSVYEASDYPPPLVL